MATRVVIIGGGIAGTTLAEALAGDAFEITLIERETHPLYSRVLLPHYLRGQVPRERVFLKQESWYQAKGIEWMRGVDVFSVDQKNKFVATSEGREIPYDVLVIAGGGDVRLRQEDLPGIQYLRGVDDADLLLEAVRQVSVDGLLRRAVVLGSSFIAIEFLNYLKNIAQFETYACLRGSGFWPNVLDTRLQDKVLMHVKEQGVHLQLNCKDIAIEGEGRVERVVVDGTPVENISIVGAGIGIIPDMSAYAETTIERDNAGIHVNEYLETNVPGIYAIGDISHYDDVHAGRKVTIGNWQNALMQGRHLAKILKGERVPFELVTSYATNLLGLEITFIGDTVPEAADGGRVIEEGDSLIQLFERKQALVGAIILGAAKARPALTNAIKEKTSYGA